MTDTIRLIISCKTCGLQFCECIRIQRDKLAQKYYSLDYDELCRQRKNAVNDVIGLE